MLHRRAGPRPSWLEEWYKRSDSGSNCLAPPTPREDEKPQQCDEFPYATTQEGWNGPLTTSPIPSTKYITKVDNETEGSILQRFYSGWPKGTGSWSQTNSGTKAWPGCNITANPVNSQADQPQQNPPLEGSRYLVIAESGWKLPSLGICNGSATPLS